MLLRWYVHARMCLMGLGWSLRLEWLVVVSRFLAIRLRIDFHFASRVAPRCCLYADNLGVRQNQSPNQQQAQYTGGAVGVEGGGGGWSGGGQVGVRGGGVRPRPSSARGPAASRSSPLSKKAAGTGSGGGGRGVGYAMQVECCVAKCEGSAALFIVFCCMRQ